ncbi:DUF1674 domain-containing protein [Hyphomonas sp.]|uniref:DUF1674 domain-containing protein n=1 Tax=Hyphomonas sp. TaxID=87 RepID=UPI0039195E3D
MADDSAGKDVAVSAGEAARRAALPEAARRALEEADARKSVDAALPNNESGGPKGVEPTRYGDWERKGITYDF